MPACICMFCMFCMSCMFCMFMPPCICMFCMFMAPCICMFCIIIICCCCAIAMPPMPPMPMPMPIIIAGFAMASLRSVVKAMTDGVTIPCSFRPFAWLRIFLSKPGRSSRPKPCIITLRPALLSTILFAYAMRSSGGV